MSRDVPICNILAICREMFNASTTVGQRFISQDALFWDSNILQNEKPQRKSNTLKSRTHGSSTDSLIFLRRYEVTDFLDLTIF